MKWVVSAIIGIIAATGLLNISVEATGTEVKAVPGELIVQFKSGVETEEVVKKYGMTIEKKTKDKKSALVHYDPNKVRAKSMVSTLMTDDAVEFVQPNYLYDTQTISADPFSNRLWGLHNEGQSINYVSGVSDVDMNVPEAWRSASEEELEEVVIAVIDTGIDVSHPDLVDNIWVNEQEASGLPGVDDDQNGYVDDVNGWDFFHNDSTVYDNAEEDDHGTHVAGTIAASVNNGLGIAGIAPNVKIMPLKFIGPDGGRTSDAIRAIEYAKQKGVKISNNSWGGYGGSNNDILATAIQNSNMVFVAAAGNEENNNDQVPAYPASYNKSNILSVAAIDNRGKLADFSNYGQNTVDIAAPGVGILSTTPENSYAYMNGTSMAAPHIAGAAGLLMGAAPSITKEELILSVNTQGKPMLSEAGLIWGGKYADVQKMLDSYLPLHFLSIKDVYDSGQYVEGTTGGKSKVTIGVGNTKTYTQDTDAEGNFKIKIGTHFTGTSIKLKAVASSRQSVIVTKTVLADEAAPIVETAIAMDSSTTVTGKINEEAKVQLQIGTKLFPRTPVATDANGHFKLTAAKMKAGTVATLVVKDNAKTPNVANHDILVADRTAPVIGKITSVYNTSNFIEGTVNESAYIQVSIIDAKGNVLKELGSVESENGVFRLPLSSKLLKGTLLSLQTEDLSDNAGRIIKSTVLEDRVPPKLIMPSKLTVNDSGPQTISGRLNEEGTVAIKELNTQVATDVNGFFEIQVPARKANSKLTFAFYDIGTAKSEMAVSVTDVTAPEIEIDSLQSVYETSKYVLGRVSETATVTAEMGGKVIASAETDAGGNFKLFVNRREAGTVITLKVKDTVKPKPLEGEPVFLTVAQDTIAPLLDLNTVKLNDAASIFEGKISEEAKINVLINGKTMTKTPVVTDVNGNFRVSIGKQKAGVEVSVFIEDYAGNKTEEILIIADKTASVSTHTSQQSVVGLLNLLLLILMK